MSKAKQIAEQCVESVWFNVQGRLDLVDKFAEVIAPHLVDAEKLAEWLWASGIIKELWEKNPPPLAGQVGLAQIIYPNSDNKTAIAILIAAITKFKESEK